MRRSAYCEKGVTKEPKTKRSKRSIRLAPSVIAELWARRARQNEERLAAGALWSDRDLVFCNQVGGYIYQGYLHVSFKRLIKSCDLPNIRVHDLRHTAATLMLANGVSVKVVSEMLGHSSVAITLEIYAHVTQDMQESAARAMGQMLLE